MRCLPFFAPLTLACAAACGPVNDVKSLDTDPEVFSGLSAAQSGLMEGVYTLTSVNSNMTLDMVNTSTADNADAIQWPYHGGTNQQWLFVKASNGQGFSVLNYHSGKALEPQGGSSADGVPIVQLPLVQSAVQTWAARPASGGTYTLQNAQTGKCMDITGVSKTAGAGLIHYACNGGSNQLWKIAPAMPPAQRPSPGLTQKGVAGYNPSFDPNKAISQLGVSWYYDWGTGPMAGMNPNAMEFVPMYHDAQHVTQNVSAYKTLLGFNEPDQSGMSVEQAIALWPNLVATGLRLGSPATANGDDAWFQSFMTQAQNQNLRVDFIAVHWYGGQGADFDVASNVAKLQYMLTQFYNHYHKPLWLTEFSMLNFGPGAAYPSSDVQTQFAIAATRMLESLPFVERYAWFEINNGSNGTVNLFDPNGNITRVGQAYRDTP